MNNSSQFDGVVVAFVVMNPGLTINEICAKSGLFRHEVGASQARRVATRTPAVARSPRSVSLR
jgi:hypothetical protein